MIDTNSALYSIPLATLAANKGLVISPVEGTPLAELVKTTNDLLMASAGVCMSDTATDSDQIKMHACSVSDFTMSDKETSHDTMMDSFIADISKATANHISYAKNIVKPVIVEYVEEVQKSLGQEISPMSQFKITMVDLPKPMQNAGFETSINKYAEKPYLSPSSSLFLGEISPQGILDLMLTGSKEYDEGIKEWFVNKGDLFFMDIWNNLFRNFKVSKPSITFTFDSCMTPSSKELVDYALAIQLLSRKLYDEVPENTGLDLPRYREIVAEYREASGIKLNLEYLKYEAVLKNKMLVASIDSDGKGISVNGPIYREWLKSGGCNEALLGMLVGRDTFYNQELIDEAKERFIKDWNTYALFTKTADKNNQFNRIKDILTFSFAKVAENVSATEQETIASMPAFTQTMTTKFQEELLKLKSTDLDDIFNTCMLLVCRARFYYTDAEKILTGINLAVKANPHIDIREAALLSSIEYVVDYISDQMKLSA